jgi:hypothetical protein
MAGLGILLGLAVLVWGEGHLENKGAAPAPETGLRIFQKVKFPVALIAGASLLSIPGISWWIRNYDIMGNFLEMFSIAAVIGFSAPGIPERAATGVNI